MRNIIKHKRISAVTILMILVIVFAVSTKKSVGGLYYGRNGDCIRTIWHCWKKMSILS